MTDFEPEFVFEQVRLAGMALRARLEKLEVQTGEVGLMFLTSAEAIEIRDCLKTVDGLADEFPGGEKHGDRAMRRVLIAEMDLFIDGLSHEILRTDGEVGDEGVGG